MMICNIIATAFLVVLFRMTFSFVLIAPHSGVTRPNLSFRIYQQPKNQEQQQQQPSRSNGGGPNWLERSFPVKGAEVQKNTVEDYNLGLSGVRFQVGPLSLRMYDAMTEHSSSQTTDPVEIKQILRTLKLYAMDFTAKEAVSVAFKQNGLEMALQEGEQDVNLWGEVDSIQLLDMQTDQPIGPVFDDWEDAVDHWTPGQAFNFVVRQVPAKMRELSLEELLRALDPDGSLRKEAKESGVKNMLPDTDESQSLAEMASENVRRAEGTTQDAVAEEEAFVGTSARGYQTIEARDLESFRINENALSLLESKTVLHVMGALVSHGCLVVDISNGGTDMGAVEQVSKMWATTVAFFDTAVDGSDDTDKSLPSLVTAVGTSSPYAKIGYASYNDGDMQFLETRLSRETGDLLPTEVQSLLGQEGCNSLKKAFEILTSVGKNVVRIAVTASALEAAENIPGSVPKDFDAALASDLVSKELVDDGGAFDVGSDDPVCMSPHRICRYSNKATKGGRNKEYDDTARQTTEIFGAHTDSSFVTIVPVAAVSGLEVFDEAADQWLRPELAAKRHYEEHFAADDNGSSLPWYSRYVIIMPGEFLQILSRQEILASVHRVVATRHGQCRYSAPILLRGRSSTLLDATRYFGKASSPLLKECDGMTMDAIHTAMQPGSCQ